MSPDDQLRMNRRRDPTRTSAIRRRFVSEINRRYNALRRAMREVMRQRETINFGDLDAIMGAIERAMLAEIEAKQETGLAAVLRKNLNASDTPSWVATYMEQAFTAGMTQAVSEVNALVSIAALEVGLSTAELAKRQAVSRRLEALKGRTFEEIRNSDITMIAQIRRSLMDGMAAGENPNKIAATLAKRIDVGRSRARTIARTEVIRAHHQARIESFRQAEVLGVEIKAEFSTAGDDRVCPECAGLEGRIYTMSEVENLIPVHPNCRCVAIPHVE